MHGSKIRLILRQHIRTPQSCLEPKFIQKQKVIKVYIKKADKKMVLPQIFGLFFSIWLDIRNQTKILKKQWDLTFVLMPFWRISINMYIWFRSSQCPYKYFRSWKKRKSKLVIVSDFIYEKTKKYLFTVSRNIFKVETWH